MSLAWNQAIDAWKSNEIPIGAVIVHNNQVIGAGHNRVESLRDPTAHAEILALGQAAKSRGNWRLNACQLYVTKEPCPMCAGAAVLARLEKVFYAVRDSQMGFLGGASATHKVKTLPHRLEVEEGPMSEMCQKMLQTWFKARRANPSG